MVQQTRGYSQDELSVVEDLDPEIGRGREVRVDLLLGAAILLAVVALAGWVWWRSDYQAAQYREGQDAAGMYDLEAALHSYEEASGYRDADARASSIREQMADRDRLYEAAIAHGSAGQWLQSLRDVRSVGRIQPDYKDLDEMEARAIENIYRGELSGKVVQREGDEGQGLYWRGSDGWVWLKGSDEHSAQLGVSEEGYVVYDVPQEYLMDGVFDTVTSDKVSSTRGAYAESGRIYMIAKPSVGTLGFEFTLLDSLTYDPYIASKDGYWAVPYVDAEQDSSPGSSIVREAIFARYAVFQPYSITADSYISTYVTNGSTSGRSIVYLDPNSNRYLLAEWTGAGGGGPTDDTALNLYLCAAGSETKELVLTVKGGGLQSAQISPDGRFVIVSQYHEMVSSLEHYYRTQLWLVDMADGGRARIISGATAHQNPNYQPQDKVDSVFVQRGGFAGKLLLGHYTRGTMNGELNTGIATVRIIDPGEAIARGVDNAVVAEAGVWPILAESWQIVEQNEDGLLMMAQGNTDRDPGMLNLRYLVKFTAGRDWGEVYEAGMSHDGLIMGAKSTESHVSWMVRQREGEGMRLPARSVYGQRRYTDEADAQVEHSALPDQRFTIREGSGTHSGLPEYLQSVYTMSLGDKMVLYIMNGDLHARTYDSEIDLVLEPGITAIFEDVYYSYTAGRLR